MELHRFEKKLGKYEHIYDSYISIKFLSEFNSKWTVKDFIRNNSEFKLEDSDFDLILKANDEHIRAEPIEYPYFSQKQVLDFLNKVESVIKADKSKRLYEVIDLRTGLRYKNDRYFRNIETKEIGFFPINADKEYVLDTLGANPFDTLELIDDYSSGNHQIIAGDKIRLEFKFKTFYEMEKPDYDGLRSFLKSYPDSFFQAFVD